MRPVPLCRDERRSISGTGRSIPSNKELDKADLVKQKWAVGENKELVQHRVVALGA
jgi:hypothetical protein